MKPYLLFITFSFLVVNIFAQTYTEVAKSIGIDHAQVNFKLMGGGVAFFDYDNDGFLDLYLTGGSERDKLYHNNQIGNYVEVGLSAGLAFTSEILTMGVSVGDIDNDGFRDIFVTTGDGYQNILLKNNGDETFTDIAASAQIDEMAWSTAGVFGDYNLDGLLDIYVVNYVSVPGFLYNDENKIIGYDPECYANFLYVNNGDGTFSERAQELFVGNEGCGLATTFTDYDNDNDLDLYIANDFGEWHIPNVLFNNQYPNDNFVNRSEFSASDLAFYAMGIAIGDYDMDGDFDYYVTNLGKNALLNNQGNREFVDYTDVAGVANSNVSDSLFATGWGTAFLDYNNDGNLDLIINNGEIPGLSFTKNAIDNPNKLFKNIGAGKFVDVSLEEGIIGLTRGRGLAHGDYDNDGDLDVLAMVVSKTASFSEKILFYKNNGSLENNWLKINLEGTKANRDALGAKVSLFAEGKQWLREIGGGSSHVSQNSSIAHFGLGRIEEVDSIIINWPGGTSQKVINFAVNQELSITEDTTVVVLDKWLCTNSKSDIYLEGFFPSRSYKLVNRETGAIVENEINSITDAMHFVISASDEFQFFEVVSYSLEKKYEVVLPSKIVRSFPTAKITLANDSLIANDGIDYRWYYNDQETSLTTKKIVPKEPGNYSVQVTNQWGCTALSDKMSVQVTGINQVEKAEFMVFPNPTDGIINFRYEGNTREAIILKIRNSVGTVIFRKELANNQSQEINISRFPSGIYMISIVDDDKMTVKKIIKL